MGNLTQQELHAKLRYDASTGVFTWASNSLTRPNRIGTKAGGARARGYWQISVNGKVYVAHRLAWLYVYGELPAVIDHINGDTSDNRIDNLRVASQSNNLMNTRLTLRNTTGAKGIVAKCNGKFKAQIIKNYRKFYLGTFATKDEAAHAYNKAAVFHFGDFAVLNPVGADK